MNAPRPAAAPTELLAHLGWVQRLARALVRDASSAEDLAQETLRVTLAQPSGRVKSGVKLRAWLRSVMRRLALDRFRSEQSRLARERAFAPREAAGTTFEIVERGAKQQRVAQAVLQLAEPYRSTLLYRYLDELTTRDVAVRMEVSEEVVRKRIERGLAQLREALDREFGTNTKRWALALLSWQGVAVVTVKMKLAVAAVVVIGAALAWRAITPSTAPHRMDDPSRAVASAPPATAKETPAKSPSDVAAVRTDAIAPDESSRTTTHPSSDATILHVAVVDRARHACVEGRLAGFWSEARHGGNPQRSFETEIAGPVTDVVLPMTAGAAVLTASVEGQPPSSRSYCVELRPEADPAARHGTIERNVTIEVGDHPAGPRLSGQVFVDGDLRVPRGLDCFFQTDPGVGDSSIEFRVHAVESRYEAGPMNANVKSLWITSDETVPRLVDVESLGKDGTLDLDLVTERTLELTVVDRRTNRPLPGVELYLFTSVVTASTFFQESWRETSHFVVTDARGIASITGIPREGRVDVHRDAMQVEREVEVNAGQKAKWRQLAEPLLSIRLTKKMPDVVKQTLRLDVEGKPRRLFGQLSPEFLADGEFGEEAAEIHYATLDEEGRFGRKDDAIAHDEKGAWQLEVRPDSTTKIWVERERRRVSQVAEVKVADDDVGPIALAPRTGTDVLLRLVRCPAEGFVSIYVKDPGAVNQLGTTRPLLGGTYERRLRLEGPTSIQISCFRDLHDQKSCTNRQRDVDPATTPVVEFDLASGGARALEFSVSVGQLPDDTALHLLHVGADGTLLGDANAQVHLIGGKSRDAVVLAPGRYLYKLIPMRGGIVAGVVDVSPATDDAPIRIRCELETHRKSELGAGVQLDEIGGVQLGEKWRYAGRLRFDEASDGAAVETIVLPAGAKFTRIER